MKTLQKWWIAIINKLGWRWKEIGICTLSVLMISILLLNETSYGVAAISNDLAKAQALSRAKSAALNASARVQGIWQPWMRQSSASFQGSSGSGPGMRDNESEVGLPQPWEGGFGVNSPNSVGAVGNSVNGNVFFSIGLVGLSHWDTGVSAGLNYNTKENLQGGQVGNFRIGSDTRLQYSVGEPNLAVITGGDGRSYPYIETIAGQFSSPLGEFDKLTRNLQNGKFTLEDMDQNKLIFGADGLPEEYQTRGNTASVSYTYTDGLLTSETDDSGRGISYDYVDGRLQTITDPEGRVWTLEYDINGRLWKITYPRVDEEIHILGLGYDQYGHLNSLTDLAGNLWEYGYHPDGKLAWHQTPEGATERTTLAYFEDHTEERLPLNPDHPSNTLINNGVAYAWSDEMGSQTTVEWNADLNMLPSAATDGEANRVQFSWDGANLTGVIDQESHASQLVYYPNSSDLKEVYTPESGALPATTYEYTPDGSGNIKNIKDYNGEIVSSFTYNPDRRKSLKEITDGEGRKTTINEYDLYGNVKQVTSPDGTVSSALYTSMGYMTQSTDALGATFYTPDNWLRTRNIQRGTRLTQLSYNPEDLVISSTNPRGYETTFEYDKAGRLTKEFRPNGAIFETRYDLNGRVRESLNANGEITSYTYNPDHTLLTLTNPLGIVKSWDVYDGNKNVRQYTHSGIGSWSYDYDKTGSMTYKLDPDGRVVTSGYDFPGNGQSRSWMDDWTGHYEESFNPVTRTLTTVMPGNTVHKVMNKAGEIVRMTQEDRGDFVYTYNPITGQLTSLLNPEGETTGFAYRPAAQGGMLSQKSFANGTYVNYPEYTTYGEVGSYGLFNRNNERLLSSRMTYDGNGNRTLLETDYFFLNTGSLKEIHDEYDEIDQISKETYVYDDEGEILTDIIDYNYDLNGNRNSLQYTYEPGGYGFYRYNYRIDYTYSGDQLQLTHETHPGHTVRDIYDYDQAGRIYSITRSWVGFPEFQKSLFTYDCNSHLEEVQFGFGPPPYDDTNKFTVNSLGQVLTRQEKGVEDGPGIGIGYLFSTYKYDGFGSIASQLSRNDNRVDSPQIDEYLFTPGISEIGGYGSKYYGGSGNNYDFITFDDGLSMDGPEFLSNYLGGSGGYYGGPFGFHGVFEAKEVFSTLENSLYFHTSLVQMGARHYDQQIGRFLQPDPAHGLGGDPNLYAALNNNPISYADPMGTDAKKIGGFEDPVEKLLKSREYMMMPPSRKAREFDKACAAKDRLIEKAKLQAFQNAGGYKAYMDKSRHLGGVKGTPLEYGHEIDEGTFDIMSTILGGAALGKGVFIAGKTIYYKVAYNRVVAQTFKALDIYGQSLTSQKVLNRILIRRDLGVVSQSAKMVHKQLEEVDRLFKLGRELWKKYKGIP